MSARRTLRVLPGLFFLVLLAMPGCQSGSPTQPTGDGIGGGADFNGGVDPGGGDFVLKRISVPDPDHRIIPLDLVGSNLRVDAANGTVSLDVAIHNAWTEPIYGPVQVLLSRFEPPTVIVANPDDILVPLPEDPTPVIYLFDYTGRIPDETLAPGATSQAKLWVFDDPGLAPFSFQATAQVGLAPSGSVLGGRLFFDENRNGVFDSGDAPFTGPLVAVQGPDGFGASAAGNLEGRWTVRVDRAGLYTVAFHPPLMSPVAPCFTTPNPLQVLLTADADGTVHSFLEANFGFVLGPCPSAPSVQLTDSPPDSILQDPYALDWIELRGDILAMQVGFSGCGPDHPFQLWAGAHFMESNPVQTWVLLQHDDRGELCDAYWTRTLEFDLDPLRQAHIEQYGQPGVIVLRFTDYLGVPHRFEFGP